MLAVLLLSAARSACDGTSLLSLETSATGNCGITANCFQSGNYPENYGTNEDCIVAVCERVTYAITSFETEYEGTCQHDYLSIASTKYCGHNFSLQDRMPAMSGNLDMNDILRFESDDGNEMPGFKICVTLASAPEPPPFQHESDKDDDPAKSAGAIVGYVAAALVVGGGVFYYVGRRIGEEELQGPSIGSLVF